MMWNKIFFYKSKINYTTNMFQSYINESLKLSGKNLIFESLYFKIYFLLFSKSDIYFIWCNRSPQIKKYVSMVQFQAFRLLDFIKL